MSTLELLLLVAAERGISTPYELHAVAGLSVGASIPALKRLVDQGLLAKSEPGIRGRQESRLTAQGKKLLAQLPRLLAELPAHELTETDSLARALVLAAYCGEAQLFRQLADRGRQDRQERLPATPKALGKIPPTGESLTLYRWLLGNLQMAKLRAEDQQLKHVAQKLTAALRRR
jgi:DNA-binding PadR family transcriptional regulator